MFLVLDVETNDMPNFSAAADAPDQARILEICGYLCTPDLLLEDKVSSIIRPDGWTIAEGAQKVHGISFEQAMDEGRPIADVLQEFDAFCDIEDLTLIGHSMRFDLKMIRGERRRAGVPDRFGERREFDTMQGAKPFADARGAKGQLKFPTLAEAFAALVGGTFENAHRAEPDVEATRAVAKVLLDKWKVDVRGEFPKSAEEKAADKAQKPTSTRAAKPKADEKPVTIDNMEIF